MGVPRECAPHDEPARYMPGKCRGLGSHTFGGPAQRPFYCFPPDRSPARVSSDRAMRSPKRWAAFLVLGVLGRAHRRGRLVEVGPLPLGAFKQIVDRDRSLVLAASFRISSSSAFRER